MTRKTAEEQLILVDESNRATGSRKTIYRAGLLHRASRSSSSDPPRTDRAAAAQSQEISLRRIVGDFRPAGSAPGRADDLGGAARPNEELGVTSALSLGFFARYRGELSWACTRRIRS